MVMHSSIELHTLPPGLRQMSSMCSTLAVRNRAVTTDETTEKERPGKSARHGHEFKGISLHDFVWFNAGDTYQTFNYNTLPKE